MVTCRWGAAARTRRPWRTSLGQGASEGTWYFGVTPEAAVEIVREHFKAGRPVERLIERDPVKLKKEFLTHRTRTREVTKAIEAEKLRGGG